MLEGGRSRGLSASFSTLGGCHLLHDCSSECVALAMDPLPTGGPNALIQVNTSCFVSPALG